VIDDPTHKHHDGLPHNQIRDLIATEERDQDVSNGFYGAPEFRAMLVARIAETQRALAAFDKGAALRQIAKQFGWTEHDVSDFVTYDAKSYHGFYGTDEEFKAVYPEEKRKKKR
jgi:hypothetical protein